jgi:phenylacetate-CoA ligase
MLSDQLRRANWHLSRAREYPGLHRLLRQLREEDALEAAAWREKRRSKLARTLAIAGRNVPYYRDRFREVGLSADEHTPEAALHELPLLSKETVRAEGDRLIHAAADRSRLFANASGGSTGTPLRFYQDASYRALSVALDAFVREWWGVRPHDRTASIWGADRDLHEMPLRERLHHWRFGTRFLNAFRMTEKDLTAFATMLRSWRPPYLMGYASALEAFARHVGDRGLGHRFRAIRSTAEMLRPQQRRLIEDALGSPVYDFYGSREVNNLAAECREEKRLHLISTWRIVEIVDDEGLPVSAGEVGHIAVTDLSNEAMPFIRYLNGDAARAAADPCPCGRASPVIEDLLGRTSDLIRATSGELVHGEYFTHLFYGCESISAFQIRQTSLREIVLSYVATGRAPEDDLERIVGAIRERLGDDVAVRVERCEEIPVTPSGKRRFTISDLGEADRLGSRRLIAP